MSEVADVDFLLKENTDFYRKFLMLYDFIRVIMLLQKKSGNLQ